MVDIVYLHYGPPKPFADQVMLSIASMAAFDPGDRRVSVFTNTPAAFADVPVAVVAVTDDRLQSWFGPTGYKHRAKIACVQEALARGAERVVLVDADTVFRADPTTWAARLGPTRSLMHVCEGRVSNPGLMPPEVRVRLEGRLLAVASGDEYGVDRSTAMYNSGLVGMHASHLGRLPDVLAVVDRVCELCPNFNTAEQLAFSLVLGRTTHLETVDAAVEHYWNDYWVDPYFGVSRYRFMAAQAEQFAADVAEWGFDRASAAVCRRGVPLYRPPLGHRVARRVRRCLTGDGS